MKTIIAIVLTTFAIAASAQATAAKPAGGSKGAPECAAAKTPEAKFAAVDKNKDGVVDMAEAQATRGCGFLAHFKKAKIEKIDAAAWAKAIESKKSSKKAAMDGNKDGKVSKDERAAAQNVKK